MIRWSSAAMGLLIALGSGHAHALEPESEAAPARVLVLPVQLQGELPPSTATELRSVIADNLVDDGLEVVTEGEGVCEDDACRKKTAEAAGARWLVGTTVVADEDEFTVTITVFSGPTGESMAPFENACSICGLVEVRDMTRLEATDARAEILRQESALTAVPTLVPEPVTTAPPPPPPIKMTPAGWALIGAGAASTIGGVVLLALHKQDAGCLDNPRGGECVPLRFTTAPAGAGVLGAGVLALTSGVVMVVLGRRKRAKRDERLAVSPGGLTLRF